jgi:uncharacterized protein (TIGR03000 family)
MTLSRISCCSAVAALALGAGLARAEGGLSGALAGYTQGSPLDRGPLVPAQAYAASAYYPGSYGSLASPIFMSTINAPGIYGAYSYGVAPLTFNREPLFYPTYNDRSVVPPIFMTTLNTPGIYGAYSYGVAPLTLNREPLFYPAYDPREVIPAITVTVAPLRDRTTPAGIPTMNVGPGYATLRTIPGQSPTWPALTTMAAPSDNVARVVVRVPEDARLEFGGVVVEQAGRVRKFTSPTLTPGQEYRYDVRATWTEDGRPVVKDRQIFVYAGEKADVDFLRRDANEGRGELHTLPALVPGTPPVKPTRPPARE